jgi:hypothetical protein
MELIGFHGVIVSAQDSESCDPSSNLGGTYLSFARKYFVFKIKMGKKVESTDIRGVIFQDH